MEEARFWQIIDEARKATEGTGPTSRSAHPDALKPILLKLSDDEVEGFGKYFYKLVCDLNAWRLWAAGFILAGGMGDDSFHYFRSWIVGKGKDAFDTAMTDPAGLERFVGAEEPDFFDNELLEYVAVEVLEERGKGDPRDESDVFADDEPAGEVFDEDAVEAMFPNLVPVARRLGNWE